MQNTPFKLAAQFSPMGDQPTAIKFLTQGANDGVVDQV
jgi:excinuclease UvrABC helicase subunit UvrB